MRVAGGRREGGGEGRGNGDGDGGGCEGMPWGGPVRKWKEERQGGISGDVTGGRRYDRGTCARVSGGLWVVWMRCGRGEWMEE